MKIKEEQVKIYVSYPQKKKNIYIYIYIFWDMNYLSCSLALFNYSSPIYLLMKEKKKKNKKQNKQIF